MTQVTISIDVSDMEKAISFYTKALGCKVLRAGEEMTKLATENVDIYILKKAPGSNPLLAGSASRSYDRHWTPVHLDFSVSDLEHAISQVLESNGTHEGSESGDWGAIAFCADPFGNGFCLLQTT